MLRSSSECWHLYKGLQSFLKPMSNHLGVIVNKL